MGVSNTIYPHYTHQHPHVGLSHLLLGACMGACTRHGGRDGPDVCDHGVICHI